MTRRIEQPVFALDYPAMIKAGVLKPRKNGLEPRVLHRRDCWHPPVGAIYRRATRAELRGMFECYHCAEKARKEAVSA